MVIPCSFHLCGVVASSPIERLTTEMRDLCILLHRSAPIGPSDRENGAERRHNGAFVQDAITFAGVIDDEQPSLWQDRVRLDPSFFSLPEGAPSTPVRGSYSGDRHPELGDRRVHLVDIQASFPQQIHTGQLGRDPPIRRRFPLGAPDQADLSMKALSLALAVYPEARADADKRASILPLATRSPQGRGVLARHRLTGDSALTQATRWTLLTVRTLRTEQQPIPGRDGISAVALELTFFIPGPGAVVICVSPVRCAGLYVDWRHQAATAFYRGATATCSGSAGPPPSAPPCRHIALSENFYSPAPMESGVPAKGLKRLHLLLRHAICLFISAQKCRWGDTCHTTLLREYAALSLSVIGLSVSMSASALARMFCRYRTSPLATTAVRHPRTISTP